MDTPTQSANARRQAAYKQRRKDEKFLQVEAWVPHDEDRIAILRYAAVRRKAASESATAATMLPAPSPQTAAATIDDLSPLKRAIVDCLIRALSDADDPYILKRATLKIANFNDWCAAAKRAGRLR